MSQKRVLLTDVGEVTLVKRRGNRHIRLTIAPNGGVRVSLPLWASFRSGLSFANKNRSWIAKHQDQTRVQKISDGTRIGKFHQIVIRLRADLRTVRTKVTPAEILVSVPANISEADLQSKLLKASEKALKIEAEQLLPQRLNTLAQKHGFKFRGLSIRKMTSRWGSCSNHGDIALSIYLMQLPWHLIDYVLLHELTHTVHKHHQADFWSALEGVNPGAKGLRRELKVHRPSLTPTLSVDRLSLPV